MPSLSFRCWKAADRNPKQSAAVHDHTKTERQSHSSSTCKRIIQTTQTFGFVGFEAQPNRVDRRQCICRRERPKRTAAERKSNSSIVFENFCWFKKLGDTVSILGTAQSFMLTYRASKRSSVLNEPKKPDKVHAPTKFKVSEYYRLRCLKYYPHHAA